jgi:hypothetical protein
MKTTNRPPSEKRAGQAGQRGTRIDMKHMRTNRSGACAGHLRGATKGGGADGPTAGQLIDLIRVTNSLPYGPCPAAPPAPHGKSSDWEKNAAAYSYY